MIYGYRHVHAGHVDRMARAWLAGPEQGLARFVSGQLLELGYTWDPELDDNANRASFDEVTDRVLARAHHLVAAGGEI